MNILFVADPLESFKIYKDTTFAMMRELQRRGHTLASCEPQDMMWQRGGVVTARVRDITLTGEPEHWFRVSPAHPQGYAQALRDFGAVIMRKDPPFDSEYFYATHLLEQKVDIRVIQVMLGHKKLETTSKYVQVTTDILREVLSPLETLQPA